MHYRLVVHLLWGQSTVLTMECEVVTPDSNSDSIITNKTNRKICHVRIFADRRRPSSAVQGMAFELIRERLNTALNSVFSEDGKRAVLFYLTEKYSVTLETASKDPVKLEAALSNLLGEIGWTLVKRRIIRELYGPTFEANRISVETTSLSDAFGFIRSLGSVMGNQLGRF